MQIVIADDHQLFREGLRLILSIESQWQVIAEVDNAQDLMTQVQNQTPDLVLLDYRMPGGGAVSVLSYIKQRFETTRVICLTGVNSAGLFRQLLSCGADAVLLKEISAEELLAAVRSVVAGQQVLSNSVKQQLENGVDKLTSREFQIMDLVLEGLTTAEIAERLSLSPRTVENHRYSLMKKLDVRNSAELIQFAQQQDLLSC
ncbi:response regulator [Pseudoalteromonas sp. T1lg75]|uniref:response regulator n=1 Tax=Pseudoalteromonas sp. T1lg75 TaxID=2077102 RepID=UPI000CF63C29|nr:response regulator transcription factor [Pseudoalteromonas sp. T1lg75]